MLSPGQQGAGSRVDRKLDSSAAGALLDLVPADGRAIGNTALRQALEQTLGQSIDEYAYNTLRDELVAQGKLAKGKGRGGSVRLVQPVGNDFKLAAHNLTDSELPLASPRRLAAKPRSTSKSIDEGGVLSYRHADKRRNNPEVGMVDPDSDPDEGKTRYAYDPHLDPALQFDVGRAQVERLIDDALESGDEAAMRTALLDLKRMAEPYLNWSGKAERTSFEIDTVSLHVHERIDPATILGAVQKRIKQGKSGTGSQQDWLRAWFETPLPYREAIEFYKHDRGWANRLIAGDSLLVMNSLLQKEGMAGQVQMIYIDPPYGIKYGSNFQPFVNKRDVKDRKDEDLTQEPEMIKAFRDTWELGVHSYLTYLRDRLLLAKRLLRNTGSVFVQISDENLHVVRTLLDEVFGSHNALPLLVFRKTTGAGSPSGYVETIPQTCDFLLWYARERDQVRINRLFLEKSFDDDLNYAFVRDSTGQRRSLRDGDASAASGSRLFAPNPMTSQSGGPTTQFSVRLNGNEYGTSKGGWKTNAVGLERLRKADRLFGIGATLRFIRFSDDFPCQPVIDIWDDTRQSGFGDQKIYAVQTSAKVVERCLLMATDPGDLALDPTCGSGTTAFIAERWGRRWITCDTSRVSITVAKQRLLAASYDYYELKYPHEGLKAGFIYRTVPHVTLKSIANNPEIDEIYEKLHAAIDEALAKLNAALKKHPPSEVFEVTEGGRKGQPLAFGKGGMHTLPTGESVSAETILEWEVPFDFPESWRADARAPFDEFHKARQAMQARMDASIAAHADSEVLYDQPEISKTKRRVSGPFTVEAVPSPMVLELDESATAQEADVAIARSGQSSRHHQWRDELAKTGIRGKGGQILKLADLETLPETRYLHCSGTVAESGERVVVSFGPEHAALEQRQVELAIREAGDLFPRPKMIVFCAFTFDPEAAKDIDATKGITALKAQMNTDLLTEDLKKARASNQSFWLMGQPDVELRKRKDGRYEVEVHGFDYFDTAKGELVSGGKGKIAAWALDTDYDERSLFPRQVFFPMAGAKDGWNKLRRDIKAELDESLLGKLHGTVSLPFEAGENRKAAVKIVDDRGIESLKIVKLD
jgi:adenine-specific DNA-methyltransferase